jgi:hypothetical protein
MPELRGTDQRQRDAQAIRLAVPDTVSGKRVLTEGTFHGKNDDAVCSVAALDLK